MALRTPLLLENPATPDMQITSYDSFLLAWLHSFAPYAYANNPSGPSAKLEVNTSNGTLMPGQPFVDTYYIAGAATSLVDRFATEAETPDISMVTDNYNRLREVYPSLSVPTGDTNNLQYPLYLYDVGGVIQLRTMTATDFIDTFVTPALNAMTIWSAGTTNQQAGTYFLTTSATPANATLVSATPVAVNSVANVAAYTADGIAEVQKQTIDTNYYLAMVNYAPTTYDVYDATTLTYYLPLYFDAGTESIRQHTPTTWAALLGPFLRYYLATPGTTYTIEYNLASGNQRGTTYTDTRVTPTGTGYTQLAVNVDDYRTQEFPTGTASTITANTKAFYIRRVNLVGLRAIFGYGSVLTGTTSITNLVSNIGEVMSDTTGVGTSRTRLAAADYGGDKAIFAYGEYFVGNTNIANLVSNTGAVATDTTGVGTMRQNPAAAGYGGDKAIFGYGYTGAVNTSVTNLVSNIGAVATDTTGVGTARSALGAAGYGGDKAIFGYGAADGVITSVTNLVSNIGAVATDTTGVGTARYGVAAAGYGGDKAIFGYGYNLGNLSMTNLVSNTGAVATDTTGVGLPRHYLAAAGYGGDKAIFGYGAAGGFGGAGSDYESRTNLVSNTGVVAADTTGVGTGRYAPGAASFGS